MKTIVCILLALLSLPVMAQGEGEKTAGNEQSQVALRFGYLSYNTALEAMPQFLTVREQMKELRQKYDAELKRVEDEFNQKYEAFLEGRKDFPRTILLKRQTELQELLERNIAFKEKSRQELETAEAEAMKPLRQQLNEAIATVARQKGLVLVLNTDGDALPFIDSAISIDVSEAVGILLSK